MVTLNLAVNIGHKPEALRRERYLQVVLRAVVRPAIASRLTLAVASVVNLLFSSDITRHQLGPNVVLSSRGYRRTQ